jgi:hypothetical protein
VAIDGNSVDHLVGERVFGGLGADDGNLPAGILESVCFLPDSPIEWNRKILDDDYAGSHFRSPDSSDSSI